jgi:hypothetical protein
MPRLMTTINGVELEIVAPALFLEFIAYDFRNFPTPESIHPLPRLVVEIFFEAHSQKRHKHDKFVGDNTWIRGNRIMHSSNSGINISLDFSVDVMRVDCWIEKAMTLREEARHSAFQRALRWAVQWPLIEILERFDSWEFIHASAIEHQGAVLILMGESGVGKSTTAKLLEERHVGRVVADNFVGIKNGRIASLPETWRVNVNDSIGLPPRPHKVALGKHHLPLSKLSITHELAAGVALARGRKFSTSHISSSKFADLSNRLRSKSREFPESGFFFALPLILQDGDLRLRSDKIFTKQKSYFMSYDRDVDGDQALDWLSDCLKLL